MYTTSGAMPRHRPSRRDQWASHQLGVYAGAPLQRQSRHTNHFSNSVVFGMNSPGHWRSRVCACAVLESHHSFTMFNLLRMPQYNILSNLKVCVCICICRNICVHYISSNVAELFVLFPHHFTSRKNIYGGFPFYSWVIFDVKTLNGKYIWYPSPTPPPHSWCNAECGALVYTWSSKTTPQASACNKYIYRGSHAFTHLLTHPLISLTHTKYLQPPAL